MIKAIRDTFMRSSKKKIEFKKIRLGICAMDKKSKSKPMREILSRFPEEVFDIVIFGDNCILQSEVSQWPVVEVLIAFASKGFPLEKALEYVKLRKPVMINDLEITYALNDRRKVYKMLIAEGIDVPRHVFLERDDPNIVNTIEEFDEYIVVNGVQINKPLVEKPVDAEDHNIYIYYPMSAGGGSKRLFRKISDRSSEFYPDVNELRAEGSYIYEEFVVTQGTDVKVYTVGPDYGHAEARKSPVVDGRVNRDGSGLEIRYPVILSHGEKAMTRKIVTAFKQTVCGFDILRVQGKSYCCDVNGFSFVKNSRKYYDDASMILIELMVESLRPELQLTCSTRAPLIRQAGHPAGTAGLMIPIQSMSQSSSSASFNAGRSTKFPDGSITFKSDSEDGRISPVSMSGQSDVSMSELHHNSKRAVEHEEELRCVVAIIRHGDRTPKQKMKVVVSEPKYLEYFHFFSKSPQSDLKVKSKAALVRFLEVTREIVSDVSTMRNRDLLRQLKQIRDVLERWEISGINRKVQMKPLKWEDEGVESETSNANQPPINTPAKATQVMVILKWGGDLTPLGREQAEKLGETFREVMYPDTNGGGMLRLHATYRHDLKIRASDEGRVMKTAAAFAKGLLELEGQLTPILASLVQVEEKNKSMLDREGNREIKDEMDKYKRYINLLQSDEDMTPDLLQRIAPGAGVALQKSISSLSNPHRTLQRIHSLIGHLCDQLNELCKQQDEFEQQAEEAAAADASLNAAANLNPFGDASMPQPSPIVQPAPLKPPTNLTLDVNRSIRNDDSSSLLDTYGHANTPSKRSMAMMRRDSTPALYTDPTPKDANSLYLGETLRLMTDRWEKLYKDFYSAKAGMYDLSKVPDVYDSVRYEVLHNSHLGLDGLAELLDLSTKFENSVVPLEYGHDRVDKRKIGAMMCHALLEKIKYDIDVSISDTQTDMRYRLDHSHAEDLNINTLGRCVRTRCYFTSESHLHSLINVLRYAPAGEPCAFCETGKKRLDEVSELSYLTQVVFRLFEDKEDPSCFRCEVSFSPGAVNDPWTTGRSSDITPYVLLNKSISADLLLECLDNAINATGYDVSSRSVTPMP